MMTLAIDCGSTNHKVALFDERLQRQAVCAAPVDYRARNGERVEFEPEWIWRATVSLVRQACVQARVAPSEIATIALASQAQTFTLLGPSGQPAMPFVSWMDKRAVRESEELAGQLGDSFRFHCSFPSPLPQLQLSKLAWLRRHSPELFSARTKVVSLPSFLALRLAGLHTSDPNLGAMSGLYSCQQNDWWPVALNLCGLDREQMGDLVTLGQGLPAADNCSELTLSPRLRLVCAGNDQTAGAYANASRGGRVVLTLGTALVVYRYAGESPGPFHAAGCWGPYPGGGFYELAACDEGCAALDWAVEQLIPRDEARFFELAATAIPGGALFYPQRMWRTDAWQGENERSSRARAVLEGICFRARQMVEAELKLTLDDDPVCVIGGGSHSALWLTILANVLNCPVVRGKGDILLGAASIAQGGVLPPTRAGEEVIEPTPRTAQLYDALYHSWLEQSQPVSA
jgi:sugar (pentulose or hexulose) kinase